MTTKTLLAATSALLLAACGGSTPGADGRVFIQADLASLSFETDLVVTVEANPAKVTTQLAYDIDSGSFKGAMGLPAGLQVLTVQALADRDGDGQTEVVAAGSAETTIAESQVSSVVVLLMDLTPPPPVPDHRPIITSAGLSNANPLPGESISAWVSAVDVDEDPMTYLWEVECNAGSVTIADPTAATTTITVDAAATCSIAASVMANGKTTTARMNVQVGGSGLADVTISLVSAPVVGQVYINDPASGYVCSVDRDADEGTCADPIAMGAVVDVFVALDADSDGALSALTTCGGEVTLVGGGLGVAQYTWQLPQVSGVCMVTATMTRQGRTDALPVAMLLQ
jgi:hypothetical protein